jgi:hypothetical protein
MDEEEAVAVKQSLTGLPTQKRGSNKRRSSSKDSIQSALAEDLEGMKRKLGIGYDVHVEWHPGAIKFRDGRQLEEEVKGDTIFIYAEKPNRAKELLAHGFAEWLLNQHTKKYRLLINKLIEVFEQIQYEEKEKIVDAISKLIGQVEIGKKFS